MLFFETSMIFACLNYLSREPWPLDGMTFETLKEQHAWRKPEDLEIDLGMSSPVLFLAMKSLLTIFW